MVELICDGVHVHPALLWSVASSLAHDRSALVTDAVAATGLGDGEHVSGNRPARITEGVPRLDNGSAGLAGSTLTMDAAIGNAAGVSVPDAIRAATETSARVLGLAKSIGSIAVGNIADLVILGEDLMVKAVMAKGEWVS